MRTINFGEPIPAGVIEAFNRPDGVLLIESQADYASVPPDVAAIIQHRTVEDAKDNSQREAFEAEQIAAQEAAFEDFKARAGMPVYKAEAVKIAAEKLAVIEAIETAINDLVQQAGDKTLLIWWAETSTISRGDAQWQQIEPVVVWPKGVTADDLFALAAQI